MVRDKDFLAIFNSIHRVLKAEKELKAAGVDMLLIPAPRELSADCGLAIRYAPEARAQVETILEGAELLPAEIFQRTATTYRRV